MQYVKRAISTLMLLAMCSCMGLHYAKPSNSVRSGDVKPVVENHTLRSDRVSIDFVIEKLEQIPDSLQEKVNLAGGKVVLYDGDHFDNE